MVIFDFKRYHLRSINAASGQDRAAINQELKDLYVSLSDNDKRNFDEQLERFLSTEVRRLKSDYEAISGTSSQS